MKAVQCQGFGDKNQVLSVQDKVRIPNLRDIYEQPQLRLHPLIQYATRRDRTTHMLIQTLAVALAPGDARVLSGETRYFQGPPSFPYIPGGDCCGVVVEPAQNNNDTYFQKGDIVAVRFTVVPRDALAQYARVSTTVCEKVDPTRLVEVEGIVGGLQNKKKKDDDDAKQNPSSKRQLSPQEIATLASASPAVCVSDYIRPGERVLILGAGGGIGSHLCQLVRHAGASFVCGVSQTPQRLLDTPLNCDDAVDYRTENILESIHYQKEPFDTLIDLASIGTWPQLVQRARKHLPNIVKPANQGGRYLTLTSDTPTFTANNLWTLLHLFMFRPLWRTIWSRLNPWSRRSLPTFHQVQGLPNTRDILTRTLDLAYRGQLVAVVDGPYPMTTSGVRQAFEKLQSRHAHGKVVIQVPEPLGESLSSQADES